MSISKAKTRVLIIEDHPLLRRGIVAMINQQPDFCVCSEIGNAKEAISAINSSKPDAVILDLTLQGVNAIETLKDIKAQFPELKVMVLSMHDEAVYAPRALRAGALGYVMKQESPEKVVATLRRVLSGQVALSEDMSSKLLNRFTGRQDGLAAPVELLSDRELQVFSLLGQGLSTRGISEKLHLSVKTIESHRAHIKEKLQLQNASELLRHAVQWANSEGIGHQSIQDGATKTAH